MNGPYSMDMSQPTLAPDADPATIEAYQAAQQKKKVADALMLQSTQPGATAPPQAMQSPTSPLSGVAAILQNPMMMQRFRQLMAQQQATAAGSGGGMAGGMSPMDAGLAV